MLTSLHCGMFEQDPLFWSLKGREFWTNRSWFMSRIWNFASRALGDSLRGSLKSRVCAVVLQWLLGCADSAIVTFLQTEQRDPDFSMDSITFPWEVSNHSNTIDCILNPCCFARVLGNQPRQCNRKFPEYQSRLRLVPVSSKEFSQMKFFAR